MYVVGCARTPFGGLLGGLSDFTAPQLGSIAIRGALQRAGVAPDLISEVIMGNVVGSGLGQAPARQAALGAGLPPSASCMTINKVCGSSMKAVMLANSGIVVAGGMESLSNAPHLLPGARTGYRLGDGEIQDSLIWDGLWDVYSERHMGSCVEECLAAHEISRESQDEFAILSYKRALEAQEGGFFAREIVPVDGIFTDEGPSKVDWEKISTLAPAFGGTITAANASSISDGAAALVLASEEALSEHNLKAVARIVSSSQVAGDPTWFSTAPVAAIEKALELAGWSLDEVDLFEVNEAFAAVPLMVQKELGLSIERLNVHGGAVALGHPIGASGARLVMTLISALQERGARRGVAAICIGGGEATAISLECVA